MTLDVVTSQATCPQQEMQCLDGDLSCTQPHLVLPETHALEAPQAWGKLTNLDHPSEVHLLATPTGEFFTIGRQASCNIRIPNSKISAVHCQLFQVTLNDGTVQSVICDRSTNGTFINSKRLIRNKVYKLQNGDDITFVEVRNKALHTESPGRSDQVDGHSFGSFLFQSLNDDNDRQIVPLITVDSPPMKKAPIRFRRGELLGHGGFGQVYLGMDMANGKLIAVKQVDCRHLSSESELQQVKEEILLLKALSHPRIVHYLGFSQTDTKFSILLEYVPGGSIRSLLSKFGKFEESVISSYTYQLLQGLEYLHSCGVIHRDIKAANVLVSDLGEIKVADFGACYKKSSGPCDASKLWGTPLWMAPESVRHNVYSTASDIWALGCTVLEMATSELPWAERQFPNPVAVLYHLGQCTDPPNISPAIPANSRDFIQQCLQMDAGQRPTIHQLLQHPLMKVQADVSPPSKGTVRHGSASSPVRVVEVERKTVCGAVVLSLGHPPDDTTGSGEFTFIQSPSNSAATQLSQHCSFLHHRANRVVNRCLFSSDGGHGHGSEAMISAALQEVKEWLQEEPSTTSDDIQCEDPPPQGGGAGCQLSACKRLFSEADGQQAIVQ